MNENSDRPSAVDGRPVSRNTLANPKPCTSPENSATYGRKSRPREPTRTWARPAGISRCTALTSNIDFEYFNRHLAEATAEEQTLTTKDEILRALIDPGHQFASFLEQLSDQTLAEQVTFPPPVAPSTKSRLEMLLSFKEHEMHYRAQLMVYQRMLGIVPHLTRQRQARRIAPEQQVQAAGR